MVSEECNADGCRSSDLLQKKESGVREAGSRATDDIKGRVSAAEEGQFYLEE